MKTNFLNSKMNYDYSNVTNRNRVYRIIKQIRNECEEKNYKNGYIISKVDGKQNGYCFTRDYKKIEKFLTDRVEESKGITGAYENKLEIFEKNRNT